MSLRSGLTTKTQLHLSQKFPHSYSELPAVSRDRVDLRSVSAPRPPVSGASMDGFLVKAHGSLMIVAWVAFASTGSLIARRARQAFTGLKKPGGKDPWFYIHRFNMSVAALLTVAGFITIVVQAKGYSHMAPRKVAEVNRTISNEFFYRTLHPPLGILVVIMAIVNPLMGVFRPPPDAPNRLMFKYTHWAFGMVSWIIALVVICIGLDLPRAAAREESKYVMGGFVVYFLIMEIMIRAVPYLYVFCANIAEHQLSCVCPKLSCVRCCKKKTMSYSLNPKNEKARGKMEKEIDVPKAMATLHVGEEELLQLDIYHHRIKRCKSLLMVFHIFVCFGFAAGIIYLFVF